MSACSRRRVRACASASSSAPRWRRASSSGTSSPTSLLEPVADLVEEPLHRLLPRRPPLPLLGEDLLAGDDVGLELLLELVADPPVDDHEPDLEVVQEAAPVEVVAADRRPDAVDHADLRVHHPLGPLEDAHAGAHQPR